MTKCLDDPQLLDLEPGLVVSGGLTAVRLGMVAAVKRPALERIGHAGYRRHPVRRWQLHHRVTC